MNISQNFNTFELAFPFNSFLYAAEHYPSFKIFMSCIAIATGVLGFVGNCLCIAVLLTKSMRTKAYNVLLITLSIWDNILIVTFLHSYDCVGDMWQLIKVGSLIPPLYFGVHLYPYVYPTWLLAESGSTLCTMLVNLERYLCVCHPLKFRANISNQRIFIITTLSYAALITVYIPSFQWLEIQEMSLENETIYKLDITQKGRQNDYYSWYTMATLVLDTKGIIYFFVRFVLTFLVMCWWNIAIVKTLKSQNVFREKAAPSRKTSRSSTTTTDGMTKLIIAIVNVTVVKQLLFLLLTAIIYFGNLQSESEPPAVLIYLAGVYSYVLLFNSCVNFLLYCALGSKFREELCKIISCLSTSREIVSKESV